MKAEDRIRKTLEVIDSKDDFINPWRSYDFRDGLVLKVDENILIKDETLKNKILWKDEKGISDYQIPVPINGNYLKAKYLLLYSNPGTEKSKIKETKDRLLKCFRLDKDAELVLPNLQWENWYIGELDKFYTKKTDDNDLLNWEEFSSEFCFINFLAYPTEKDRFNFNVKELKKIKELPSTVFAEKLVKIGIDAGKEIIVIRRSEGVWKHSDFNKNHLFKKLKHSYDEYLNDKENKR